MAPMPMKGLSKEPPPFNLTVYKGGKNVVLSRSMVHFLLRHPIAVKFREWLEDTFVPDESFYATMIRYKTYILSLRMQK